MKIAIIGAGISGLGAAYLLSPQQDITVYEKNHYIGGHSRTVTLRVEDQPIAVDTGFIVFNHQNYPTFTKLLKHLNVPIQKSDMSFGVSIDNGWLEYGTKHFRDLLVQKRNLIRPDFWRMLLDILRFNQAAPAYLSEEQASTTLGECLKDLNMGSWFKHYYLLAMGSAIWSTPSAHMEEFPAKTFVQFFLNHGLLSTHKQLQWYTLLGGSKTYVNRLTETFKHNIKLNCPVRQVIRQHPTVLVEDSAGNCENYDHVIFACPAYQVLKLLKNPSQAEQNTLSCFRHQNNRIILHSDTRFMPKRKKAWSSWVYLSDHEKNTIQLSYWMNRLQSLDTNIPLIVTLNPQRLPKDPLIHDQYTFEHPIFDQTAVDAQSNIPNLQGKDKLWYCGAWQRYGFHEDGLVSAVKVAQLLGAKIPWA